jgi:LysM repeat protein
MTDRLTFTFIALLIGFAGALTPVDVRAQSNVHIVEEGETLFSIAQRYGSTVSELRAYNNLRGDNISVGQRLVVRTWGTTNRPEEDDEMDYGARPSPPGVRPADLVAPERVPTGPPPPPPPPATIIRIDIGHDAVQPLPTAAPGGGQVAGGTHVVRAGDTLFSLARQYATTVEAIQRADGLRDDRIAVGQRLLVPGGGAPPAVAQPQRPGRYDVRRSTVPDDEIHVVLPGETLFSIAARYGTTAGRILASNSVTTGPLTPGTTLVLPDGVGHLHHRRPAPPRVDEEGLALIYPSSYIGRSTISGEVYDPDQLTASHRELPFDTILLVRAPDSGRQALVRVNDRGPVSEGFLIELSQTAADVLGLRTGAAHEVEVQILR